ncbi:cytochrome c [Cyanobium sp. Morenito 9A2]|uniref:c-type cytochrome n=1 Tax=Cyanobium sp. Morenito 9A2 TaxID=2823718 RepID=UPI0020CD336A|nr:cytochrome c [Cyanobium sp. Morenito 9A2]
MTSPPVAATGTADGTTPAPPRRGLIAALLLLASAACLLLVLVVLPASRSDPYTVSTLEHTGSAENGGRLFLINCAGCHGIAAQGLVGPNLHGVSQRRSDARLIHQVVSGSTPPMPKFQPEPQAMADLLAYLHSLV